MTYGIRVKLPVLTKKNQVFFWYSVALLFWGMLKGTSCSPKDTWDLPYLLQLLTWLHVSDHRNFWNDEKLKSFDW